MMIYSIRLSKRKGERNDTSRKFMLGEDILRWCLTLWSAVVSRLRAKTQIDRDAVLGVLVSGVSLARCVILPQECGCELDMSAMWDSHERI